MYKVTIFDKLSIILVLIGALNWGMIGLFNFNLITLLSLGLPIFQRIVYILIFISALNLISLSFRCNLINTKN